MKGQPEERAIQLAQYLVETGATARQTAAKFGVSKSTVHKDTTERLYHLNLPLYTQAHEVLMKNKEERRIRGGMATRKKCRGGIDRNYGNWRASSVCMIDEKMR